MEETPLERLRNLLMYLGTSCDLIPITDDMHFETLLVVLDKEPETVEEFQYVAQIYFVEDILNVPDLEREELELDQLATLQFIVSLPLNFKDLSPERKLLGLEMLQICSHILPAGSLGMNPTGDLFFKYSLKSENKDIALPVITDVLNMAGFFIHLFMPFLNDVVDTDTNYETFVKEIELAVGGKIV